MNKVILVLIILVIAGAVFFVGGFPQNNTNQQVQLANAACVDYDPPDFSQGVTLSDGTEYGLLKQDAAVNEGKFGEMKRIDSVNGKDVYIVPGVNYFNQQSSQDIIYVLINTKPGYRYFDLYIKRGVAIPDYIKNCKQLGGNTTIVLSEADNFPPPAFNKTDIINLKDNSLSPGYVYDSNKISFNSIKNLNGIGTVGSIKVKSKNRTFPLYNHLGSVYLVDSTDAYEYLPSEKAVNSANQGGGDQLQLQALRFINTPIMGWWTPECKPAIYLYPASTETVHVQVHTTGEFTYTAPSYPLGGWRVVASPDGTIMTQENGSLPTTLYTIAEDILGKSAAKTLSVFGLKSYPYLYYEAKIPTNTITPPRDGYVVSFSKLSSLFDLLLPKLGLNANETSQFKSYWIKALPSSPYYFVGVMNQKSIDALEPLEINPHPDTLIRVRLYFEALNSQEQVTEPVVRTPKRNGFTVVEWGGMVKPAKNSAFTCSQ